MKKWLLAILGFTVGAALFISTPVFGDTIGTLSQWLSTGTGYIYPRNSQTPSSTQYCLGGDCRTVWPVGATSSSLFTSVSTTNLYSSGTANLTSLTFGSATGTNLNVSHCTGCSNNGTIGLFAGFTTNSYDGKPTFGASTGYTAANAICNANITGSHVCTFVELQTSNAASVAAMATNTTAWIANGPPGYLANSNDCEGWLNNDPTGTYAPFWNFSLTTGGVGSVVSCANTKTFACCK